MYLAEAIPPAGPLWYAALVGLGVLAAIYVAIGILKLSDAIVRAFFGKVEGAIGWIPFANKVVHMPLHKIEQKLSHSLGSAEAKLDEMAAVHWHNMARLVHYVGLEIAGAAETGWRLMQQAKAFVHRREVAHDIHQGVKPANAKAAGAAAAAKAALTHSHTTFELLEHGVLPRVKAVEHTTAAIGTHALPRARADAKTAEDAAIASYKYLVKHRRSVIAGVFTGATAWALARLGGNWIRCKNARHVGKKLCRMPFKTLDALLTISLALLVRVDPVVIAEAAVRIEDVFDPIIKAQADPSQAATDATKVSVPLLEGSLQLVESPLEAIGGLFPQ